MGSPGELQKQIAEHIAELIPDGATMQMGIGEIPDAVLLYLKDKRDLGVHTELFSDGVIELIEAGVLTNAAKTHPPRQVRGRLCARARSGCTTTWTTTRCSSSTRRTTSTIRSSSRRTPSRCASTRRWRWI